MVDFNRLEGAFVELDAAEDLSPAGEDLRLLARRYAAQRLELQRIERAKERLRVWAQRALLLAATAMAICLLGSR